MGENIVLNRLKYKLKNKGFVFDVDRLHDIMAMFGVELTLTSIVLSWLRECKKIHIVVDLYNNTSWFYFIMPFETDIYVNREPKTFDTYDEAVIAGIEDVLDNVI